MFDYSSMGKSTNSNFANHSNQLDFQELGMPLHLATYFNLFVFPSASIRISQEHVCFLKEPSGNKGLFTCSLQTEQKTKPFKKSFKEG